MAQPAQPRTMHWYDHISVNLFWLGLNFRNTAMGSILMPYLVDVFARPEIKNTALAEMRTAGLIVAMLAQPAVGLLSDRSTSRFGRRRPFIFVGVLLDIVLLVLVGLSWNYWSLLAAVLLQQLTANISHGALQGLIPDLVPEDKRGVASAVKAIFELLPIILVALTVANLMGAGELGWAIAVTAGVLLVTMLLTMVLVHEEPLRVKPTTPLGPPMLRVAGMLGGILAGGLAGLVVGGVVGGVIVLAGWLLAGTELGLVAWLRNDPGGALAAGVAVGGLVAMIVAVGAGVWGGVRVTLGRDAPRRSAFTWWTVNRLMFLLAVTSIQGFAPYYLMYAFSLTREAAADMTGSVMAVVGVSTMIAALPGGWLGDRFGARRIVAAGGLIATLGTLLLLGTMALHSLTLIYAAGCVVGLGSGLWMSSNWALGTRLVPPDEAGRYLGVSNLAGAGAGMIGSGIGGPMADAINHTQAGLGYFVIFGCYGVLFLLSTFSLWPLREVEQAGQSE
jgi:MFS family permease